MGQSLAIARRFEFAAAHRLKGHESRCRYLHGHNYILIAEVSGVGSALDSLGRVIDFGEIKSRIGAWIDERWDHGMILAQDDDEAIDAAKRISGQKVYLLDGPPTAEKLALHLLTYVGPTVMAGCRARLIMVTIWETSNSKAVASLEGNG